MPLYKALRGGTLAAVEMLLEAGADPNCTLTDWAGLQWPALGGNLQQVKLLLDQGGDPSGPCAESALRWAVQLCRRPMIELLVTHGVDIDTIDADGRGLLDMVGKSDWRPRRDERVKTTALLEELMGLVHGSAREARLLRLRGDLVDAVIEGRTGDLRAVQAEAPELFERELVRDELLHWAASRGHGHVVDLLVELGAPMTISVAAALGRVELVDSILTADPSLVEGRLTPEEIDWNKHLPWHQHSPLIVAAMNDRAEVAALLLDQGAGIDRQVGWYQTTALHHAVSSESTETVRLLLERGADVTIRSRNHHLPTALVKNWPPTVSRREIRDLLVAHGARPRGTTPSRGHGMTRKIYAFGMDGFIVPMMKRFAAEGSLPHFERMLREGVVNQTLPSFPVWTPTNWATLSTGAHTGTHGVTRWRVEVEPGRRIDSFDGRANNAERIWNALERAGMTSVAVHYPAAHPSGVEDGLRGRRLRPPQPPAHRLRGGHLPGLYHTGGAGCRDRDGPRRHGRASGPERRRADPAP